MKLYIVKYCANEFDDLGYDDPYAIFYSLDEQKAKDFFENERKTNIEEFNYSNEGINSINIFLIDDKYNKKIIKNDNDIIPPPTTSLVTNIFDAEIENKFLVVGLVSTFSSLTKSFSLFSSSFLFVNI